jgi:chemotaxis protein methyltransferase CheR
LNRKGQQRIKDSDFRRISSFVEGTYGIKLPDFKKYLIESRLLRRMNKLGIRTYREYLDYLFDPKNSGEIQEMIDVVSTHKTDFYRENDHFEFMRDTFLPEYVKNNNKIDLWSAGSSSGEEAYTLAFVISEFNRLKTNKLEYKIYGSDVSLTSVKQATNGVYSCNTIEGIPLEIKKRYFLRNKNIDEKLVRIIPEIRKNTSFFKLNFLDKNYGVNKMFDFIMCRNTLIYFSREVQESVLRKLLEHLKVGGYLLIGHSESIFSMNLPVELVKTTIFRKL